MEKRYLSVSALNRYLKAKFEQDKYLKSIDIRGEISNLKKHYSGHYYFTLKDENARISAIMFNSYVRNLKFDLKEGMQVLIHGSVIIYESGGTYSIQVYTMEIDGIGNLYLMIEKTKKKLYEEGLFDSHYKKGIPKYPNHIGVLAAKDSAALHDIINTINRRYPIAKLYIYHIPVQGNGAYKEIIKELLKADQDKLDVILLARGGGSLEDLMNFNEEALVRCIFSLKTPIITGVGHEIDTTLVDYVADLRAPTPTGAAMLCSVDLKDVSMNILEKENHLIEMMKSRLQACKNRLSRYENLPILLNQRVKNERLKYNALVNKTNHLSYILVLDKQNQLNRTIQNICFLVENELKYKKIHFNHSIENLQILSPLNTLLRGYSIVMNEEHVIRSIQNLTIGETVDIRLSDGNIKAAVLKKEKLDN